MSLFCSSKRRHTRCALVTGVQTCALPISDVRLTTDRRTAEDLAAGRRPALDAFIAGDLVLGGDARALLENRSALEALGDLFARVKAEIGRAPCRERVCQSV